MTEIIIFIKFSVLKEMMITVRQMQQLEQDAVQQGVSLAELMENAGREVYNAVKEKYDLDGKQIVIFCGPGNNGGDGLVAARYFAADCRVLVLFFGKKEQLSDEARENYRKVFGNVALLTIDSPQDLQQFHFQKNLEYVFIDALLGTGLKGPLREPISSAIDLFNTLKGIKVAVDVPSGMDPDTGEVREKASTVDLIVCFHDLKAGLQTFRKKTVVVDIGIPV